MNDHLDDVVVICGRIAPDRADSVLRGARCGHDGQDQESGKFSPHQLFPIARRSLPMAIRSRCARSFTGPTAEASVPVAA